MSKNPFDEDEDDEQFRKARREPANEELGFYERKIEDTMQDSLASTKRSLKALEESEQIGLATAEDLLVQGEKLRKIDKQLDEIQQTTSQTQKHLNNIKSVFGGFKNWFGGKGAAPAKTPTEAPSEKPPRRLESAVSTMKSDTGGFYEDSDMKKSATAPSLSSSTKASLQGTRWGAMDEEIDENLDVMSQHLQRLKNLGLGLGDEIESQNQVIDRVAVKADKNNVTIRDQDKQMKRILGQDKKAAQPPKGGAEAKDGASSSTK